MSQENGIIWAVMHVWPCHHLTEDWSSPIQAIYIDSIPYYCDNNFLVMTYIHMNNEQSLTHAQNCFVVSCLHSQQKIYANNWQPKSSGTLEFTFICFYTSLINTKVLEPGCCHLFVARYEGALEQVKEFRLCLNIN